MFEVVGRDGCVAKMYTNPISGDKAQKLEALTALRGAQLTQVAAWPLATVVGAGGMPSGFVMPSLAGYQPLHALYSPSSRKQLFPGADWSYLIHAAKNLSAAFAILHRAGVVIGDVNENLAFIDPKTGIVKLIDADSMQVKYRDRILRCEVGVAIFTPPELHYSDAFRKEVRTPDHDAFGLAVLVFHLLYFGRHPYAGVPTTREDLPIEKAIPGFHYAYRVDRTTTNLKPPPGAIPVSVAGSEIVGLFERAFSPSRAPRPSPADWFAALQNLSARIKRCESEGAHVYSNHMSTCPWCVVEEKVGIFLFISRVATSAIGAARFNLKAIWSAIDAISRPTPVDLDALPIQPLANNPLSFEVRTAMFWKNYSVAIATAAAGIASLAEPNLFLLWVLCAWMLTAVTPKSLPDEVVHRQSQVKDAEATFTLLKKEFEQVASSGRFDDARKALLELRRSYESLPGDYQRSLERLKSEIRQAQMMRHLSQFTLRTARIAGVGDSRKETLRSFGIDTAADVNANAIGQIKGFGPKLVSSLLAWRHSKESSFVFDPKRGVDPQDVARLNRDTEATTRRLESEIRAQASRLQQLAKEIDLQRRRLLPLLTQARYAVAQARADAAGLPSS